MKRIERVCVRVENKIAWNYVFVWSPGLHSLTRNKLFHACLRKRALLVLQVRTL